MVPGGDSTPASGTPRSRSATSISPRVISSRRGSSWTAPIASGSAPPRSPWMRWRYSMRLFDSLGRLWLARGEPARAREFADRASTSRRARGRGRTWSRGGAFAPRSRSRCGEFDDAETALREALGAAVAIGNPTQLWKTQLVRARLSTARGAPTRPPMRTGRPGRCSSASRPAFRIRRSARVSPGGGRPRGLCASRRCRLTMSGTPPRLRMPHEARGLPARPVARADRAPPRG